MGWLLCYGSVQRDALHVPTIVLRSPLISLHVTFINVYLLFVKEMVLFMCCYHQLCHNPYLFSLVCNAQVLNQ